MNEQVIQLGLILYAVFVFSTVLHEAGHALAAWKLGDPTAYEGGQVSLDPWPHMRREPVGMVVVPLLSLILNQGRWLWGWASAPYDPRWAMDHPRRAALMALAGPVANFLLAFIAAVLLRACFAAGYLEPAGGGIGIFALAQAAPDATGPAPGVALALSVLFSLNVILGTFNLLPLPPLDGAAILTLLMPRRTAEAWLLQIWNPQVQFAGMLAAYFLGGRLVIPVWVWAVQLLLTPL